jgi:hypothetical protein
MPNTNNKIPTVSLNKSDICSNTEHPIPSQEINPSSQNIPQTRCAISLINRPQPCCCRDFSAALFLPHFSASLFLPHFSATLFLFFSIDFSIALFLAIFLRTFSAAFFCHTFSAALFLPHCFFCRTFSAALFLPHFFCRTFPAALFCCNFSLSIIPAQITFHKIDIQ